MTGPCQPIHMNTNAQQWGPMHEIVVPCTCMSADDCRMERYIADVRILHQELEQLKAGMAS